MNNSEIKTVNVRFSKFHCETEKAYRVEYRGEVMWVSKRFCWDLNVAGNDLHAWAVVPAWKFKEITGNDINELAKDYGTKGLREIFDCSVGRVVTHHVPEKVEVLKDNVIEGLKR